MPILRCSSGRQRNTESAHSLTRNKGVTDVKRGSLAYPLTLALLALPGALEATTPVSGNLRNLATLPPGMSAFVRFTLRGCQGAAPTVPNVAMLAGPGQPYFQDFVADVNGLVTGVLYSTRDATG